MCPPQRAYSTRLAFSCNIYCHRLYVFLRLSIFRHPSLTVFSVKSCPTISTFATSNELINVFMSKLFHDVVRQYINQVKSLIFTITQTIPRIFPHFNFKNSSISFKVFKNVKPWNIFIFLTLFFVSTLSLNSIACFPVNFIGPFTLLLIAEYLQKLLLTLTNFFSFKDFRELQQPLINWRAFDKC